MADEIEGSIFIGPLTPRSLSATRERLGLADYWLENTWLPFGDGYLFGFSLDKRDIAGKEGKALEAHMAQLAQKIRDCFPRKAVTVTFDGEGRRRRRTYAFPAPPVAKKALGPVNAGAPTA